MGATAIDSTIGVGCLFITPSVVVLLLYVWFFGQRCVFLAFHVVLLHFLGIGIFLSCVVGDGGLLSVFFVT